MRRGHIYLVFIYQLIITIISFFLPGNLDPGSTHIISLSAHNKVGFSKSARLRVSLPIESQHSDAGEESKKSLLAAVKPIVLHSRARVCAELDPDLLLHLPAELHHRDAGAEPGPGHSGCHRLWIVQTQRSRYNAFINPHYWAYN